VKILDEYQKDLKVEKERLRLQYGENHRKVDILNRKIEQVNLVFNNTRNRIQAMGNMNFIDMEGSEHSYVNRELKTMYRDATSSMKFSSAEQTDLFALQDEKTKEIMTFFGIKSTTQSYIEKLTDKVNRSITKRIK
jgi:hypothetical protein